MSEKDRRDANRAAHIAAQALDHAKRKAERAQEKAAALERAKARKKFGRPTKFTWDVGDRILAVLKHGNHRETAAASAGVHIDTFREWLRRGAKGEEPFAKFSAMVDIVEAQFEGLVIKNVVERLGKARISEVLDFMARRSPKRWGLKSEVTVFDQGSDGKPTPAKARAAMKEIFGGAVAAPDDENDGEQGDEAGASAPA